MADILLAQAKRDIKLVEKFLKEGYVTQVLPGSSSHSTILATSMAALTLGIPRKTFIDRVGTLKAQGLWWRRYKLKPDWSLYKAPELVDEIEQHRERINHRDVITENKRLRDALVEMQDIRAGVLKLTSEPMRPRYDIDIYVWKVNSLLFSPF
jgi:hypothetical protein